jgi:DNA segregation ATPase FtsK/SpoIIIE-like protein
MKLDDISFNPSYICSGTLKIKMPSSFGYSFLDFADGASCHLLNGGTTRMGKTVFLLYTATMLYIQTKGNIQLHITSTKIKDYYPFHGLSNVTLSRTESELNTLLDKLAIEFQMRDQWLMSDSLKNATDAKSVKELYPEQYYLFRPIFIIIDEYARFADNRDIQKKIMNLVESAGYVNIHLIISTQRPDARTVLPPRIKANLLARICFTTADKNNSLIILDREGAETLGKKQGRAYFLDSDMTMIQVPFLDTTTCEELLQPYKREMEQHEEHHNETNTGSIDNGIINEIQNHVTESISNPDFQFEHELNQRNEQSHETPHNGWFRLASTENKG